LKDWKQPARCMAGCIPARSLIVGTPHAPAAGSCPGPDTATARHEATCQHQHKGEGGGGSLGYWCVFPIGRVGCLKLLLFLIFSRILGFIFITTIFIITFFAVVLVFVFVLIVLEKLFVHELVNNIYLRESLTSGVT